jgi:hypothetical protein
VLAGETLPVYDRGENVRLAMTTRGRGYAEQIGFVADRPDHELRYATDATRIRDELGWCQRESFESGLEATVRWYLGNEAWWRPIVTERATDLRRGWRHQMHHPRPAATTDTVSSERCSSSTNSCCRSTASRCLLSGKDARRHS